MAIAWPQEEADQLRSLWADGKTIGEIAKILDKPRGAIAGKLNRLKLFNKTTPESLEVRRQAALLRAKVKAERLAARMAKTPRMAVNFQTMPRQAPVVCTVIADVSNARPWTTRQSGECAFPLGERGAIHSCCAPTSETYCTAHRAIVGGLRKPFLHLGKATASFTKHERAA